MRFTLDDEPFRGSTGQGVIVAVLDSGIHGDHPHVGGVQGGYSFTHHGDVVDRIGHGTAVAAAIREKAPGVALLAVKVFHRQLATNVDVLARAIVWSGSQGASIINLSLGTANGAHADHLREAVEYANLRGAVVVSPCEANDVAWLPGSLSSALGVVAEPSIERDEIHATCSDDGVWRIRASPFPRPIPNVPRERNLSGVSFAVANTTGFLARAIERDGTAFAALEGLRSLVRES